MTHSETARFDPDRAAELVAEMGEAGAERLIGRSLEDIAVALNRIERAGRSGDRERIKKTAREIAAIADYAGFSTLGRVARDALRTADTGSDAAHYAVLARLLRVGESTLMPVCDMRNMPI
ncbi:MAG: hypothetical protein HKO95_01020 [Rhodobacteraceae bacterium]|nr:hypothetical protein [Alphaproteobacteria bacterium]NNF71577.1 hypothetical protein [Paracoccaceae bacterium]NNK65298.1 hypothetical protein [Paracoccaceae bacterium]